MSEGELILYSTEDGAVAIRLRAVEETVWLSQREIAELFDKDVRTVNEHIRNVFAERECDPRATIRKFRIVQTEGARQVERETEDSSGYIVSLCKAEDDRGRSALVTW